MKDISQLKAQKVAIPSYFDHKDTNFYMSSSDNNSQYLQEDNEARNFQKNFLHIDQNGRFSPIHSASDSHSKISNKPIKFGEAKLVKKPNTSRSSSMDSTRIMVARDSYFGRASRKSSFASNDMISSISIDSYETPALLFSSYQDDLDFMERNQAN
jgi:hypothetical protein